MTKIDKKNRLLVVDDNDEYSDLLITFFEAKKECNQIERARDAEEGFAMLCKNHIEYYDIILTDITMETQISGLIFLRKAQAYGYKGTIIVASTGFDVFGVKTLSCLLLGILGVNYIIPKKNVKNGNPILYKTLFSQKII